MKCLNKVTMIGAKILEILHWFTTAIMLVIAAGCLFMRERLADFLTAGVVSQGTELTSYGFEITAVQADGTLDMTAVLFFAVTAVICLSLPSPQCLSDRAHGSWDDLICQGSHTISERHHPHGA